MKREELKIKVRSLSAECTIIRLKEDTLKARARKRRAQAKPVDRLVTSFWSLREHRGGLREEVRATHLAIAFLRGRSYAQAEKVARSEPPLGRALAIADPRSRTVIDLFCGGGLGAVGWAGRAWEYIPAETEAPCL